MNKTLGIVLGVIACLFLIIGCSYNGLVTNQEKATTAWADVQASYQRRADLIPNLVETVKGYAKHEQETFTKVTEARAKATQITIDPENLTPEKLEQFKKAQGELSAALGRLIAVAENFPSLQASKNFSDLQVQLEGTENRILEARRKYNEAVQSYNVSVRAFPNNIFANMFGFEKMTKFEADPGSEKAPTVKFDN
jgi:LemA protein